MSSHIHSKKKFQQLFERKPFSATHANSNFIMPLSFSGSNTPINISINQDSVNFPFSSSHGFSHGVHDGIEQNRVFNPFSRKKNKHCVNERIKERLNRTQNSAMLPLNDEELKHRLRLETQYEKQIFERVQGYRQKQNFEGHKTREQILFEKLVKKRQGINRSTEEYRKKSRIKIKTEIEVNTGRSKNSSNDSKTFYQSEITDGVLRLNFKPGVESKETRNQFEQSLESQNNQLQKRKSQTNRQPFFSKVSQVFLQTERLNLNSSSNYQKNSDSIDQQLKFLREQNRKLKTSREKFCQKQSGSQMSERINKIQVSNQKDKKLYKENSFEKANINQLLLRGQLQLSSAKSAELQKELQQKSKIILGLEARMAQIEQQKVQIMQKNNQLIELIFSKQAVRRSSQESSNNNISKQLSFTPSQAFTQKFSEPDSLQKLTLVLHQQNNKIKENEFYQLNQDTPRFSFHLRKSSEIKSLGQSERVDEQAAMNFLNQSTVRFSSSGRRSQKQQNARTKSVSGNQSRDSQDYLISSLLEDIKNLKRKDLSQAIQEIYNQQNTNQNFITLKNIPLKDSGTERESYFIERQQEKSNSDQQIRNQVEEMISPELKAFMNENQALKSEILILQSKIQNQCKTIRHFQAQTFELKNELSEVGQKQTFYQQQILHMKDILDRMKTTNKNLFSKMKEVAQQKQKIQEICQKMHEEYLHNIDELNSLKKVNQSITKDRILLESQISQLKQKFLTSNDKQRNTQSQKELTINEESVISSSETESKKIQNYDLILGIFGVSPDSINHNEILMKKIVLFQNNIIKITSKLSALQEHIHEMQKQEQQLKLQNSLLEKKVVQLSIMGKLYQQKQDQQIQSMAQSSTSSCGLNKNRSYLFRSQSEEIAQVKKGSI